MNLFRLLVRPTLISIALSFAFLLLALMAGRSLGGHIITSIGVIPRTNRVLFHLVDLEKGAQINIRPPINGIAQVALAPDGKQVLIYTSNTNLQAQAFLVFDIQTRRVVYREDMPGQNLTDIFVPRQFEEYQPLWSPDSRRIAFRDPGSRGLYVIDLMTLTTHHLLEDSLAFIYGESWSPDGQTLVFMSGGDIWMTDVHTYEVRRLTNTPANIPSVDWSPDSTRIAYHYLIEAERLMQSFVLNTDTAENQTITPNDSFNPEWSPDGEWIVYLSGRNGQRSVYTLHLVSDTTYLLQADRMEDVHTLSWSPDSREIALADSDGEIYLADPTGTEVRLAAENGMDPQWSPDSQYLMFERVEMFSRRLQQSLHLRMENRLPQQVTSSMTFPRWSADSTYLSYLFQTANSSQVEVVDPATRKSVYRSDNSQYIVDFAYWQ